MKYVLNSKAVTIEEFENAEVFGITIYDNDSVIMKIEDISTDRKFVEHILEKFNKYNVSVYRIFDIIEEEILDYGL